MQDIFFQGVTAPLRLDGADAILPLLADVAAGWPFRVAAVEPSASPFFSIRAVPADGRLHCESHVEERPAQLWDPLNALCDALASLAIALPMSDPRLICLHAAGVEFAGRLIVFPNVRRAGKSTLSAALAQAGHRVFSDDVVPLTCPAQGQAAALATGLALRLRLPLPDSLPEGFRAWAAGVAGPRNRQYHYLCLDGQPSQGETGTLGAFVLLDRHEEPGPGRIEPVPPDAAMDALLHQNFTRDRHSGEVLEALASILERTPVFRLGYSALDEAVACLKARFADWPEPAATLGEDRRFAPPRFGDRPAWSGGAVSQRGGVVARSIGEGLYLADPEGQAIQRMDPLAAAIWEMLEEPATPEELEGALAEAFPETPRSWIRADLHALLTRMHDAGLLD